MGGFGAPMPSGSSAGSEATQPGANVPSNAPVDMIDENDPRLTSEIVEVNAEKDAYAVRPLPPDRKWRVKLKIEPMEDPKTKEKRDYLLTTNKEGIPYFHASVSATIIDTALEGRFEGFKMFPAFGGTVGTLARKDGASQAGTLLGKLRKPDGTPWATSATRMSHKEWIELLVRALAGEPEAGIESQWEHSCSICGKAAKEANYKDGYATTTRGMDKFPAQQDKVKRANGETHNPEIRCQKDPSHGYSRAFPKVARFLSLEELKTP